MPLPVVGLTGMVLLTRCPFGPIMVCPNGEAYAVLGPLNTGAGEPDPPFPPPGYPLYQGLL